MQNRIQYTSAIISEMKIGGHQFPENAGFPKGLGSSGSQGRVRLTFMHTEYVFYVFKCYFLYFVSHDS